MQNISITIYQLNYKPVLLISQTKSIRLNDKINCYFMELNVILYKKGSAI